MTPRKKRVRYQISANELAKEHGLKLDPNNWEAVWSLLDRFAEPQYLYVIADPKNGVVKFGKSVEPKRRLDNLNTSSPERSLELWCFCLHQSPFTEREVHECLKKFRIKGEWFRLAAPVQVVIDRIRESARRCSLMTTLRRLQK